MKKHAFTLAEVLITLGIIGIVAAMTMPTLINNYKKKVIVNKLKKFYTVMHQAIQLAEVENGDFPNWSLATTNDSTALENWYNKYLDKHIASINKKKIYDAYQVGFKDGSGFVAHVLNPNYIDIFYCSELKYCGINHMDGKVTFLFVLNPNTKGYFNTFGAGKPREELLENCKYGNFDNPEVSISGSRHYCAALIQHDGWEMKDDYPWNQIILEN